MSAETIKQNGVVTVVIALERFKQLKDEDKYFLGLRYRQNLSIAEIASLQNLEEVEVERIVWRALTRLERLYKNGKRDI